MAECSFCGREVSIPYTCGYCGGSFCPKHRLPENHECEGLVELDKKSREEGRIYRGVSEDLEDKEPKKESRGRFTTSPFDFGGEGEEREYPGRGSSSEGFGGWDFLKSFFLSDMTSKLLFIMVLVYIGQMVMRAFLGTAGYENFMGYLAPMRSTVLRRPWTLVTSIFVHGPPWHLVINGIVLFFIGSALERRIGSSKFLYLFLGVGVIAALAQVLVSPESLILGASGAILGVLGALTVINPRMPILLFFFLPMPLWMLTLGYGTLQVTLAFLDAGGNVAHVAHFVGLIVGLLYGYKLRRDSEQKHKNLFESLMDDYGY